MVFDAALRLAPEREGGPSANPTCRPALGPSLATLSNVARRQAMVALADSRVEVKAIAIAVQCSVWTVRRWIRRSKTTGDLHDRPRSGRHALYLEETKLRIVAFYCQTQPLPGCGRWSLRWAARRLEADPARVCRDSRSLRIASHPRWSGAPRRLACGVSVALSDLMGRTVVGGGLPTSPAGAGVSPSASLDAPPHRRTPALRCLLVPSCSWSAGVLGQAEVAFSAYLS